MRAWQILAVMGSAVLAILIGWQLLQAGNYPLENQDHDAIMSSETPATPDRTIRVLFVGNSLTFVHDVPAMLINIASADPENTARLEVQAMTRANATLDEMFAQTDAIGWVKSHHPDFVVLQEHGGWYNGGGIERARQNLSAWVEALKPAATTPLLFEVWADGDGSEEYTNSQYSAFGLTPQQEAHIAADKSETLAQEFGPSLVKVGAAFERAREMKDAPDVYGPDHHHAGVAGAYLSALVFYQQFTGRTGAETTYRPWGLSADDKAKLVQAASGG